MTRILVIDDEPLVCDLMAECLREDLPASVECALTGRHGASHLQANRYDLAVIDAVLPDIPGVELAEMAATLGTPALMISGQPYQCNLLIRFHFPHLRKPFHLATMLREARSIMQDPGKNIRCLQASIAELRASLG